MIVCILGKKVADCCIITEDGPFPISPNVNYSDMLYGYWQLKRVGYSWKIIGFLMV